MSAVLPPVSERELQNAVIRAARTLGWLVYHTFDSRRSEPGFPDLVMVRDGRLLFVELKGERLTPKGKVTVGRPSREQQTWLDELRSFVYWLDHRLGDYGPVQVWVWTPEDWRAGRVE